MHDPQYLFIIRFVRTTGEDGMNEQDLVDGLRNRDPRALEYFHSRYRDRIFAVARRIVRDDQDAEEVIGDVLWTIHRKIDLFNGTSALWSWCYRITENAARMKVRKYKRYPTPVEGDVLQAMANHAAGDDPNARPDRQVSCRRTIDRLNRYLDDADETNRRVYQLMDVDGLSKEEAADELGLTIPALKARLHRIRVGLREAVAQPA